MLARHLGDMVPVESVTDQLLLLVFSSSTVTTAASLQLPRHEGVHVCLRHTLLLAV